METGERLAAYLAGELDADERARLEAQLAGDPALREHLARIERADELLRSLPDVEPPAGFRQRLDAALAPEVGRRAQRDELAERRSQRAGLSRSLRPLAVAAAAAAVVAVIGLGTSGVMSGGDEAAETAAGTAELAAMGPQLEPVETDNDYDPQQLQRLAVNVQVDEFLGPGMTAEEVAPLADLLQGQLLGPSAEAAAESADSAQGGGEMGTAESAPESSALRAQDAPAYSRCLPAVLSGSEAPLVPVYVELARFEGEPAIIYAFGAPDPETDTYRRIEVWAVAQSDCQVLSYAPYDRTDIPAER